LNVLGELDLHSTAALRRELFRLIDSGARIVVADMGSAPLMESTTLSMMLAAVRRLRGRGGELRIACADPNITRIFEITLLDRVFAVFPSRSAALARSATSS